MFRITSLALASIVATAASAHGATTTFDITGFSAFTGGTPGTLNSQVLVDLGIPFADISEIAYNNLSIQLSNGSFADEFVLSANQSSNAGPFWDIAPFTTGGTPNPAGPISGLFSTTANFAGGPFQTLNDGKLLFYVYDLLNDAGNALDATVLSGSITVTYEPGTPPPPPTPPVSTAALVGGSLTGTIAPGSGADAWYSFTLTTPTAVSFDTLGTTGLDVDTELFLYDSFGTLIGTDDDDGPTGPETFLSILNSGDELPAQLPAGTYYLAVSEFNTAGGPGFVLTAGGTVGGDFVLNGLSIIPEPASLSMLALAMTMIRRRRHA
jgi:Bacterial pre-peptidase C-terminal domain